MGKKQISRKQFLLGTFKGMKSIVAALPLLSVFCRGEGAGFGKPDMSGNGKSAGLSFGKGFRPPYLELHASGELKRRGEELRQMLEKCGLCPRECETNRLAGERGDCGGTGRIEVNSHNPHYGEENPLSGRRGSA